MSKLLKSGRVGSLDKERNSNNHIYNRWKDSGLLEGLDRSVSMKVAVTLELTANIVLMEDKSCDIHFKMTGDIFDNESRYETVIFPIIRRVIGKTPGAVDYVPEILNIAKKYYNTTLSRGIYEEDERCVIYFYNNILPVWSNYHRDSEYKNYDEFKVGVYTRHVERCRQRGVDIQPFDVFKFVDW